MKQEAESITEIDKDNLDKECINLPSNYRRFAFLAAEAKRDVQEAKANLDLVEAEIARDIRSDPSLYKMEKVTETSLREVVITEARYQTALSSFLKRQHASEMCNAVVWSLEHKKRALTLLVDLHGMGYFSQVKMSLEGKEAVERTIQGKVRRRRSETD